MNSNPLHNPAKAPGCFFVDAPPLRPWELLDWMERLLDFGP